MRFRPRRLAHVNLYVGDLAESVRFYNLVCGLEVVFEEPGIEATFLSNGNSHHDIALMQASTREHRGRDGQVQVSAERGAIAGLNHLGFELETEQQLVEAIGWARSEAVTIQRILDHQISRSAYLSDPDGTVIECYADSIQDWRRAYRELAAKLITEVWEPDPDEASPEARYPTSPEFRSVPDAPVTVRRLALAALTVSDLARSIDYYQRVVGMDVLDRNDRYGLAVMTGSLSLPDLLLTEAQSGDDVGLHHFGFELAGDLDVNETAARLEAAGVEAVRAVDRGESAAVVVRDPDRNLVEFFSPGTFAGVVDLHEADREFAI